MFPKLLVSVILIKMVVAQIAVNIGVYEDNKAHVTYSGSQTDVITGAEIQAFNIGKEKIFAVVEKLMGKRPSDVSLTGPTPDWETVEREISVKSATVENLTTKLVTLRTQDYQNHQNAPGTAPFSFKEPVEIAFTSSWIDGDLETFSQAQAFSINLELGTSSFSYPTYYGGSATNSEANSNYRSVNIPLKPGEQSVTVVATSTQGSLVVDVVHKAVLKGKLAVYYETPFKGQNLHELSIDEVMQAANIPNEVTTTQRINLEFTANANVKVHDNTTGEDTNLK